MNKNWISVKDEYPADGQLVKIKIYDHVADKDLELDAIFRDYEAYRGWETKGLEATTLIAKPTHWMPLPESPK